MENLPKYGPGDTFVSLPNKHFIVRVLSVDHYARERDEWYCTLNVTDTRNGKVSTLTNYPMSNLSIGRVLISKGSDLEWE